MSARHSTDGMTRTAYFFVGCFAGLVLMMLPLGLLRMQGQAGRLNCASRMRRLGLAIHNYHDAHKVFPPGITSYLPSAEYVAKSAVCDDLAYGRASAFAMLLPYISEKSLHEGYNFNVAHCGWQNSTTVRTPISLLVCPDNPRGSALIGERYFVADAAPTDYVLSLGGNSLICTTSPYAVAGHISYWERPRYPPSMFSAAGPFNLNSNFQIRACRDGTAYTFLIGEGAGGPRVSHGMPETGPGPRRGPSGQYVDQAWSQAHLGTIGGQGGYGSVFAATAHDSWYDSQIRLASIGTGQGEITALPMQSDHPKNVRGTTYQKSIKGIVPSGHPQRAVLPMPDISVSEFRSFHRGGCNFLMVDGSVRFIEKDVDVRVFIGLSTFSGREEINLSDVPGTKYGF